MKKDYEQLSLADSQFSNRTKRSRITVKLQEVGNFVNWNKILELVEVEAFEKQCCCHTDFDSDLFQSNAFGIGGRSISFMMGIEIFP